MNNGKYHITPGERMITMLMIGAITAIITLLDFFAGMGGILGFFAAIIGIGAICAVLFVGRED